MNESEERFVDALKTENEKYKKDIAQLTHRIKELEESVEDWRNKYDKLNVKTHVQESYITAIKDAVMLVMGGRKYDDVFNND